MQGLASFIKFISSIHTTSQVFSKGNFDASTARDFIMFTVDTHMDADITMGDLGSVEVHLGGCEFMSQRDAY